MIRLQGLHKYFNKGRSNEIHVLRDVSLDFPKTGMVAIFGKSGCGKTTLLNVIGGLDRFHGGTVTIDGQSITDDPDGLRNRYVGYIFQNYNLNKNESCFENVADALRLCGLTDARELESRTMAALKNVGMENYRHRSPDTLSGGQQQRIAIARAIVKNPHIILADEPTGNLDEANTLHIMNLLREISRDRLVLLVTHEADLVDYYCDTVIELQDGRVVDVRQNSDASGYNAKDKNRIYLGELDRTNATAANAQIEYFGDQPEEPIRIRIVNNGGRLYLQLMNQEVQVLDATSEVRLCEGVFQPKATAATDETVVDMSALPPLESGKCGRLFSFLGSVKSGYLANFHKRRKGKKLLLTCMTLFSAVFVLMSSIFGTAFGSLETISQSYNHNVFYVYTPDETVSAKLQSALSSSESGVDYLRLYHASGVPGGDASVRFMAGFFESFSMNSYSSMLTTNAAILDNTLAVDAEVLAGRKTELLPEEILISSSVADRLLEASSLGYIEDYDDLIGLIAGRISVDGKNLRVAGVVRSDETAIYLTPRALTRYIMSNAGLNVQPASRYGMTVSDGSVIYLHSDTNEYKDIVPNGKVSIHGMTFRIEKIQAINQVYEEWAESNGLTVEADFDAWCEKKLLEENPTWDRNSEAFKEKLDNAQNTLYYEYMIEGYYKHIDAYLTAQAIVASSVLDYWLYTQKGVTEVAYIFLGDEIYKAHLFHEEHGRYPTLQEAYEKGALDDYPDLKPVLERYYEIYNDEFHLTSTDLSNYSRLYLVSDKDYDTLSRQYGETHASADQYHYTFSDDYDKFEPIPETMALGISVDVEYIDTSYPGNLHYTVLHSTDPQRTEEWLRRELADLKAPSSYMPALLCPSDQYSNLITNQRAAITVSIVTLAVLLSVMCVCMYFIMRSSLMNRIKEVGIYRAIGVTRRNLVFRFFVESLVLTTLTVFVGYFVISSVLTAWLTSSPLLAEVFYYPLWMAAALLVVLYGVCLFCGTVPILSLLRKTPSEILSQYDI